MLHYKFRPNFPNVSEMSFFSWLILGQAEMRLSDCIWMWLLLKSLKSKKISPFSFSWLMEGTIVDSHRMLHIQNLCEGFLRVAFIHPLTLICSVSRKLELKAFRSNFCGLWMMLSISHHVISPLLQLLRLNSQFKCWQSDPSILSSPSTVLPEQWFPAFAAHCNHLGSGLRSYCWLSPTPRYSNSINWSYSLNIRNLKSSQGDPNVKLGVRI